MTEAIDEPFLVLIFPTEDAKEMLALATRFNEALTKACGAAPTIVRPCRSAIALLVEGKAECISSALRAAEAPDTRYLMVRVDRPFAGAGLSTAFAWLQARVG